MIYIYLQCRPDRGGFKTRQMYLPHTHDDDDTASALAR